MQIHPCFVLYAFAIQTTNDPGERKPGGYCDKTPNTMLWLDSLLKLGCLAMPINAAFAETATKALTQEAFARWHLPNSTTNGSKIALPRQFFYFPPKLRDFLSFSECPNFFR